MHTTLVEAFRSIEGRDAEALGWAVLDTKSEVLITAAIATAINRRAGARIAHVEARRTDLTIFQAPLPRREGRHLGDGVVKMYYEAKAGQCFDFAPGANTQDEYKGLHLNRDITKKRLMFGSGAALFYMHEADDPTRHLKYFAGHRTPVDDAVRVLCRFVTAGRLAARETMKCGVIDGTNVKIHLCVFDPL